VLLNVADELCKAGMELLPWSVGSHLRKQSFDSLEEDFAGAPSKIMPQESVVLMSFGL